MVDSTFCESKSSKHFNKDSHFVRIFIFLDSCDSLKVRDSLLIHESPKWILRYAQYDEKVDCHDLPKCKSRNDKKMRRLLRRFAKIISQ